MGNSQSRPTRNRRMVLSTAGWILMLVLSLTQLMPSLRWAGYSVWVGIAFFFIVEAVSKTPKEQSGLRFGSLLSDMKKPGVFLWMLLPVVTAIVPLLLGNVLFHQVYGAYVIARAGNMLTYDKLPVLIFQVLILAFGEEIAWRGFFVGESMHRFPFWLCAVVSSALFAIGHIADGPVPLVLFDIGFVFIDSMIFSIVFRKSGNCLVSTLSHILGNAVGLLVCFAVR